MGTLHINNRLGDTRTNQFMNINKTDAPQRPFKLGNNHITTANFGDLIPAWWCDTRPRDKFELDANILAKFLALIAPAYCKADITVDWFFVPTKIISPRSLNFIQNASIPVSQIQAQSQNAVFDVNASYHETTIQEKNALGQVMENGIPRISVRQLQAYLTSNNGTWLDSKLYGLNYLLNDGKKHGWRSPDTYTHENVGLEDLNCYGNKYRVSRLLDYMGLPKTISTYKFTDDVYLGSVGAVQDPDKILYAVTPKDLAAFESRYDTSYFNPEYKKLLGNSERLLYGITTVTTGQQVTFSNTTYDRSTDSNKTVTLNTNYSYLLGSDFSGAPISNLNFELIDQRQDFNIDVRPFLAYQKIYNDYFRDPVKQDEIRLYPDFVRFGNSQSDASGSTGNVLYEDTRNFRRFINNVFSLRRRNYDKDWLNNSILSDQLVNQTNVNYQPFNSRFLNQAYKFALKKAVTGNRYFDFLANFMDSKGNDYLTNNVTYIGGDRFPITISETLQTSATEVEVSPQGNRSGNMNAYQNTDKHYFAAPDFGYIMCIVSLLPKISYFNGVPQRFRNLSLLAQDLPDFNNIGFQEVSSNEVRMTRGNVDPHVFGYLPFGYQHKFIPDIISGDFSKSLYWWHQSPDLDSPDLVDYGVLDIGDVNAELGRLYSSPAFRPYSNSANFPAVGLKQVNNNLTSENEYYNNIFAITTDASGDHAQLTMDFYVTCSRAMSENEILVDDSLI